MNNTEKPSRYDSTYGRFTSSAMEAVRQATYGDDDIGQHSWVTLDELRTFASWCDLSAARCVLDVGCGAGGPALALLREYRCRVTGIDIAASGIQAASERAEREGLSSSARFLVLDATTEMPFDDNEFDLVIGLDTFFHIRRRDALLSGLHRIVKPGGLVLYTDGGVVTGPLVSDEIELRSINGSAHYVPEGYNEKLLTNKGFELLRCEDLTPANESVAQKRHDARAQWRDDLIELEGKDEYELRQSYLDMVAKLTRERRLSRFAYLARKVA